jgi:hypothetical protein
LVFTKDSRFDHHVSHVTPDEVREIREKYMPPVGIRVLLLGESPPPRRGFFYTADSTLYRCTVPVMAAECGFPQDSLSFLVRFADAGFYLDDFSYHRGDHPHERPQSPDVITAFARLARLIDEHKPVAVIGVLERISGLVERTVATSTRPETPWHCLRFPHSKNRRTQELYANGLRGVLAEFGCS